RALRRRPPLGLRRRRRAQPRAARRVGARVSLRCRIDRAGLGVRPLPPQRPRLDARPRIPRRRPLPQTVGVAGEPEERPVTTLTTSPALRRLDSPWVWLAGTALVTAACVWLLRTYAPPKKIVPDYVCYWAAGKLVATGQNPYDEALQTRIQHER